MDLLPEIASRRSVRQFLPDAVSRDALERIVEAGRLSPSAKNRQSWRFLVLTDPGVRTQLEEAAFGQEYVSQAAATIALCTTNVDYTMPNGQASYPVDMGIAAGFMMLQAQREGLGTCAVTTFREEQVKSCLSVPHKMRVVMLLLVGHPADEPRPSTRLPLSRVVGWEHW